MTKLLLIGTALLASITSAHALECRSVGGHFDNQPVSAIRVVTISGAGITLNGIFNGERSPTRTLACVRLKSGVLCERAFGPVNVSVMSNRDKLLEVVTDPAGNEIASVAYKCNGALRL